MARRENGKSGEFCGLSSAGSVKRVGKLSCFGKGLTRLHVVTFDKLGFNPGNPQSFPPFMTSDNHCRAGSGQRCFANAEVKMNSYG